VKHGLNLIFLLLMLHGIGFSLCAHSLKEYDEWRYAKEGNIEILTHARDKQAQLIFDEIHYFRTGLEKIFGFSAPKWPLRIILLKDDNTIRQFDYPEARPGELQSFAGRFRSSVNGDSIILYQYKSGDQLLPLILGGYGASFLQNEIDGPPWLNIGYWGIFRDTRIQRGRVEFGAMESGRANWALRNRLTTIEEMLTFTSADPKDDMTDYRSRIYVTAWLFIHYCRFGPDEEIRQAFARFMQLKPAPTDEATFQAVFGLSFEDMRARLKQHARRAVTNLYVVQKDELPAPPKLRFSPVSRDVCDAFFAREFAFSHQYERAASLLSKPGDENVPLVQAEKRLLPIIQIINETDRSVGEVWRLNDPLLQEATPALDPGNASGPYFDFQRAQAAFTTLTSRKAAGNALQAEELNQVFIPLSRCIRLRKMDPDYLGLLAKTWTLVEQAPQTSHWNAMLLGHRRFPEEATLSFSLAEILLKQGEREAATRVLANYEKSTLTPDRRKLTELRSKL